MDLIKEMNIIGSEGYKKYSEILRKKSKLSQDFRRYITFKSAGSSVRNYLGSDVGFIREWLSNMFVDGMTWNNYGSVWVVDHIVPFRMFDLFNEEDLKVCWNYRNLMPLFDVDNLKKQGNSFFSFELLYSRRDRDLIYSKLFERIKPEVEWMVKYIDNYDSKPLI